MENRGENRDLVGTSLDDALWAFRTAYKTPIGCTPYKLVYGKDCHLPIELEHKAYWALKHTNFDVQTAGSEVIGTDNQEKNEKQSQNDKTGLGMEKTVKDKAKSKPESQSSQKVNWSKSKSTQVNPGAKVKEI
ncbi:reverse transcriptase domain-containing protein [Tanacetum coccineum]